jgi:transcription termination factor Rho
MVGSTAITGGDLRVLKQRAKTSPSLTTSPPASSGLKLETTATQMNGRIIELISPIGKGQPRADRLAPSKAGKDQGDASHAQCRRHQQP